jgi:beta-N-acetylhexosaminidase
MTLEDKAGQMLLAGVSRLTLDEHARRAIVDLRAGGIVLTTRQADPRELQAFVAQLQALAAGRTVPVPLFIAINHEGGAVTHIQGATAYPSAMAVGAGGSPGTAYELGRQSARELAALGINMNLAPVLDVNSEPANPVIGLRSFGAWPEAVGRLGAEFVGGTQAGGVIAVAKHFPGHGAVDVDSHHALPVAHGAPDELWAVELAPFRQAIDAGVEAIMSAHLAVPALTGDAGLPATLSRAVMTDLLRGRLGFDGLVVTDDLDMKAISGQLGAGEAAVRAVEAGADLVLLIHPSSQQAAFSALVQAVRSGRLPESRLDESVQRILAVKARYGLFQAQSGSLAVLGSPEHQALARQASEAAITIVEPGHLPLAPQRRTLVISPRGLPAAGDGSGTLFGEEVGRRSSACEALVYQPSAPADQQRVLAQALAVAGEYDQVVIGLWDAALQRERTGDDTPFRCVEALAATGMPVAVVAWQLPYDLAELPPDVAAVATYGITPAQVQAAAQVLFGELEARGELPVSV